MTTETPATTGAPDRQQRSAPNETTKHILIVDDDRRIRQLLKKYLTDNNYRITTAETAAEARQRLDGLAFDLIVLDVMMPGESGLDLTSALRKISPVPILLLTARGETEHRIDGLERGADDYLAKPFEPRELLLRIGTILRRTLTPELPQNNIIMFGACQFDLNRGVLTRNDKPVRLTSREVQLLRHLAREPNKPWSRLDLCDGDNAVERTIDVQITRLRRKIEPDPRNPVYLQTVRGTGYVFVPDAPHTTPRA